MLGGACIYIYIYTHAELLVLHRGNSNGIIIIAIVPLKAASLSHGTLLQQRHHDSAKKNTVMIDAADVSIKLQSKGAASWRKINTVLAGVGGSLSAIQQEERR